MRSHSARTAGSFSDSASATLNGTHVVTALPPLALQPSLGALDGGLEPTRDVVASERRSLRYRRRLRGGVDKYTQCRYIERWRYEGARPAVGKQFGAADSASVRAGVEPAA